MLQEDCGFLNDRKSDCKILKALYCKKDDKPCKFYKPRANKESNTGEEKGAQKLV